jgi:hypothetical protein
VCDKIIVAFGGNVRTIDDGCTLIAARRPPFVRIVKIIQSFLLCCSRFRRTPFPADHFPSASSLRPLATFKKDGLGFPFG